MSLLSYHQSAKKATSNLECRFALEICFQKKSLSALFILNRKQIVEVLSHSWVSEDLFSQICVWNVMIHG